MAKPKNEQHSPLYKTIKSLYLRGKLTQEELQALVSQGKITQDEYNEIIGGTPNED